jgi:hypothetical protein
MEAIKKPWGSRVFLLSTDLHGNIQLKVVAMFMQFLECNWFSFVQEVGHIALINVMLFAVFIYAAVLFSYFLFN